MKGPILLGLRVNLSRYLLQLVFCLAALYLEQLLKMGSSIMLNKDTRGTTQ